MTGQERDAAQIHAENRLRADITAKIAKEMQLRKWAVERAIEAAETDIGDDNLMTLAREIYSFVCMEEKNAQ